MFGIMFTDKAPTEYRDWANSDHDLYDAVAIGMHARGAMPEPDSARAVVLLRGPCPRGRRRPLVTIFADSLDAALELRAKGGQAPEPRHVGLGKETG